MILVALGSNLPAPGSRSPRETCARALEALAALPLVRLQAASPPYRSDPFPPSGQPAYVNAVAWLESDLAPHELLARLHAVEAGFGRARSVPNAARTLDLDLLAAGAEVIDTQELILPHPRMHLRRFVLLPLHDVAPAWSHPVLHRTAAELLAGLPPDGTRPLCPDPAPADPR